MKYTELFPSLPSLKITALGLLLATATPPALGQDILGYDITPGGKVGLSLSTQGGEDAVEDLGWRTGFTIGGFAVVDLKEPYALQPELAYIQKGAVRNLTGIDEPVSSTLRLDYLQLSVLGMYHPPVEGQISSTLRISPTLLVGPTLAYNVRAEAEDIGFEQSPTTDVSDQVRRMEGGLTVGGGIEVPVETGTAAVDLRYMLGLTSFYRGDETVRNQGIVVTAGFAF